MRDCAFGSLSERPISTPIRRIRSDCCARAASGHAAAAPPVLSELDTRKWNLGQPSELEGHVAELVGIEGGVVSGVINLESSGVEAPDRRPRHEEHYHEA